MFGRIMEMKVDNFTIRMRPFYNKEEYSQIIKGRNSQKIMKYFDIQPFAMTTADTDTQFDNQRNNKSSIVWAIEHIEDKKLIGYTQLWGIHEVDRTAKTALMIWDKEYWGKGVASKVQQARSLYSAKLLNIIALHSYILSKNTASLKAALKAGYHTFGILKSFYYVEGSYKDAHHLVWYNPNKTDILFPEEIPEELIENIKRGKIVLEKAGEDVVWG